MVHSVGAAVDSSPVRGGGGHGVHIQRVFVGAERCVHHDGNDLPVSTRRRRVVGAENAFAVVVVCVANMSACNPVFQGGRR